jgi:hypothetical protein
MVLVSPPVVNVRGAIVSSDVLRPLSRQRLHELLVERLRAHIAEARLGPASGCRLNESWRSGME